MTNFLLAAVSLLFILNPAQKEDGVQYLKNALSKFAGIEDYVVNVKVHMDIPDVKSPDMEGTVYYKEPDKYKMESKGLFFLPKEVGVFNPKKFDPDAFDVKFVDTTEVDGVPAVRVSLSPKKDESGMREVILTIDERDWLIREIASVPYPGRQASAKITYDRFGNFQLPVRIDVNLDIDKGNMPMGRFGGEQAVRRGLKGNVEIYYSNYKINSGLSDSIFKTEE
ncbi:MAG TPA: hypothetical protein VIS48_11305 [Candidatus Kryptonia bacterium]